MMYFLIIVAAIAVYVIMTRNKFNELQQMIKNGVSDIGVQSEALDRTLDKLIDIARNGYQKEIEGIAQLTAKDKLDRLLFLGQKYPDLKSIGEYSAIARKSEMLDKNLTAARQLVNGNIRETSEALDEQIFFDQSGVLTAKFKFEHTPTRITRDGRVLKIEEIPLTGAKK